VGANFVKLVITSSFFFGCKHNCEAKVEEKEKMKKNRVSRRRKNYKS